MNKNLFILPVAVLAMGLASCAKSISREDALKFVKENYKNTEEKKPKSATAKWNFTGCKGDLAIAMAKQIISGLGSELSGSADIKEELLEPIPPLNETAFALLSNEAKFSLKGKELTITQPEKFNELSITAVTTCNSEGYSSYIKMSFDTYKIDESNTFVGNMETFNKY